MTAPATRNRLIGLALAAVVAIVDQAVKLWVIGPLALRQVGRIDLLPFFDLTYTENRGVSLGMFQASSMETRWALVAVTAGIALVVLVPPFGVVGAGWALVIAYGTMFALMLWREHRVFTVPYAWGRIVRIPLVLAIAFAATLLVPDAGAGWLAVRILIAAAIPLGYIAVGFLTRAEIERGKAIVRGLRSRGGQTSPHRLQPVQSSPATGIVKA